MRIKFTSLIFVSLLVIAVATQGFPTQNDRRVFNLRIVEMNPNINVESYNPQLVYTPQNLSALLQTDPEAISQWQSIYLVVESEEDQDSVVPSQVPSNMNQQTNRQVVYYGP